MGPSLADPFNTGYSLAGTFYPGISFVDPFYTGLSLANPPAPDCFFCLVSRFESSQCKLCPETLIRCMWDVGLLYIYIYTGLNTRGIQRLSASMGSRGPPGIHD